MGVQTYSFLARSQPRQERRILLDPTTIFCPNLACPASGQIGQGNMGIHSRREQRFMCTVCHQTFTATPGPAF
jgi:transposase-like protein